MTYKMEQFIHKRVYILDGGFGTTLQDSYQKDLSSSLWSASLLDQEPSLIKRVHRDFIAAGADIILTATYQCSFDGFAREGFAYKDALRLMRSGVRLAKDAASTVNKDGNKTKVALSLGPFGATIFPGQEYTGEYPSPYDTEDALYKWHLQRLQAFASDEKTWNDIDIIAFETIPLLCESRAIHRVMAERNLCKKPFWVSYVFPVEERAVDGSSVEELVRSLLSSGCPFPYGIGINCTKSKFLPSLVQSFAAATTSLMGDGTEKSGGQPEEGPMKSPHLIIYPDGGLSYDPVMREWPSDAREGDEDWSKSIYKVVQDAQKQNIFSGFVVGGCCKTTPGSIAKLAKLFKESIS